MKCTSEALDHKRLRAPADDGGTLAVPTLDCVAEVIQRNVSAAASFDGDVQGRSLRRLADQARTELLEAAWAYSRSYRDVKRPPTDTATRLYLAGHQPQLFHPGVWFKNFVLGAVALRHGGVSVNLAIDSDTIKTASLRVPGGTVSEPVVESVPFDRQTAEIPYEVRRVVDRDCLESFGRRAAETIRPLVADPFLRRFWPLVIERSRQCGNLGECLAQARHVQEGKWGNATLEIPQSHVCDLPAFHWFACHLFARLPQLWDVYNRSVADFRLAHRIRSSAHPVPDLAAVDDWLEAPFWIWTDDDPRRRRLFARASGDAVVLSDRESWEHLLPLTAEGDAARAADVLADLSGRGVRLRTRALITTLFARLVLGDLFLHGMGGAKYDQVTDSIIERFFGARPPEYMTITATLRLPIARTAVAADDARRIHAHLRDLAYHPERHLPPDDASIEAFVRQKREWIATPPSRENARRRCHAIRAANQAMQPYLADQRQAVLAERAAVDAALRNHAILAARDYAFCLHAEEPLRRLMEIPNGE